MTERRFEVGDVVTYRCAGEERVLVVTGWTLHGKVRMRRQSGTELTAWWRGPSSMPKGYRCVGNFKPEPRGAAA